jgi:hypothetical protein
MGEHEWVAKGRQREKRVSKGRKRNWNVSERRDEER